MSLCKEQVGRGHTGIKVRRWFKNQLNRWMRREWKWKGENAVGKRKYKGWSD